MVSHENLIRSLPPEDQEGLAKCLVEDLCFWNVPKPSPENDKRLQYLHEQRRRLEEKIAANKKEPEQTKEVSLSDASSAAKTVEAWKTAKDSRSGRTYYYNKVTRKSQWEKPLELKLHENKVKREHREKQQAFFREMETNVQRSMDRGELIPGVCNMETAGPPLEPVVNHLPRVRTISGMNEQLLAELRDDEDGSRSNKPSSIPVSERPPLPLAATTSAKPPLLPLSRDPPRRMISDESSCPLQGEHLLDEPILNDCSTPLPKHTNLTRPTPVSLHSRRNTGGTMFVKSTMEKPNIKATIKCVCGVFRAHIVEASQQQQQPVHQTVDTRIFQDPQQHSTNTSRRRVIPSLAEIESFYEKFYERSQMEQDTIIMSLIYVERLIKETDGALTPTPETWASLLFSCMILASKVWDDLSMWNIDFSNVSLSEGMSPFSLQRVNQLEIAVLTCLNYNVKVPASEYAKYYFLIRTMLARSGLLQEEEADKPLNKHDARKLEFLVPDANKLTSHDRHRARSFDWNSLSPSHTNNSPTTIPSAELRDKACLEQLVSMNG